MERQIDRSVVKTDRSNVKFAIILQGFGWESCKKGGWWNHLAGHAEDIASSGFTHVWMPPACQSVSREGYLPSQLYNFNSYYGSHDDLRRCLSRFRDVGVQTLADCVFNHRCGDRQNSKGEWVHFSNDHQPEHVATVAWDEHAIVSNDPVFGGKGAKDTGMDFHAAPDLDHTAQMVQEGLSDYARYLIDDLGFSGLRFDFCKGYAGEFAGLYARAALGEDAGLAVGEYWVPLNYDAQGKQLFDQESNRRELEQWIDEAGGRCLAFDFSTKGILQEAIRHRKYHWLVDKENRPAGLIGTRPHQAVTLIGNHDTDSTQRHWPFPRLKKLEGYAYLLTHPGVPSVFWEHLYEDDEELAAGVRALIRMRQFLVIHAESALRVLVADKNQYVAECVGERGVARIRMGRDKDMGEHAVEGEPGWDPVASGLTFDVWQKVTA